MRGKNLTKAVAVVCSTALIATPVLAENASRLGTLVGLEAAGAESALRSRGFEHVSTHHQRSSVWSYWWDEEDDDCVRVEQYGGSVTSIVDATDQDCGHHTSAGAAVGVAAGAAILGALLASRSHHRDNDDDHEGENRQMFDQGYRDGLYNYAYHNRERNESYARGYSAGVEERESQYDASHSRRGGYHQAVSFGDLQGARAAGGMSEMERRGFEQVDNFTSGNTRYSIQWNDDTRQCVQITIADGRFYDLRDIGQHPRCR